MKHILLLFLFLGSSLSAQDNINFELISNFPLPETGNDIWGYVDAEGTEYAILGSVEATYIISLEDPANPRQVAVVPGTTSTWRDMKTFQEHCYVTTDAGADGLLIIDMREIRTDSVAFKFWRPELIVNTDTATLARCHNIYIDEFGFAYLAGCSINADRNDRGALILDLNQDPWNPVYVGAETRAYAHDLYVRDNIMYASEIYNGEMGVYDVSDKANPVFLGSAPTSFDFTHNIWISDDGKYAFTTDERGNAFVDAFDITDFTDMKKLDSYRPLETEGRGVIPHNTHYYDGYLVTSWYTDGVVVIDGSRPNNMVKVGAYDTYEGPDGGFSGCWGAYPFLPSGLVIASDRQTGLYVLRPTYDRACYLEGTVSDATDGMAINGALVEIESEQLAFDNSDATGEFKTGLATSGTYNVKVSHPDYKTFNGTVELNNGEVTELNVQLERPLEISVEIMVLDEFTGDPVPQAQVKFYNADRNILTQSDSDGIVTLNLFDESYIIVAGSWGYRYATAEINPLDNTSMTVELPQGYQDDFALDYGWTVEGDAETGSWVRDIPIGTPASGDPDNNANPGNDVEGDVGEQCYITGNAGGGSGDDDVDNGTVILKSPPIDIEPLTLGAASIDLLYSVWFYNGGGNNMPNDTLTVKLVTTTSETIIDEYTSNTDGWVDVSISVDDLNLDSPVFQLVFETADRQGSGHILEAGVDAFQLVFTTSVQDASISEFVKIYPNPFEDVLTIETESSEIAQLNIFDMMGRRVFTVNTSANIERISTQLESGIYLLQIQTIDNQEVSKLIIKE
ncbi:MAG: choice-of-anchor B family protein [Saprospiraceae bacterium]|nr:choice-of-anchor B family protein [Saprospiraceae bacterium]